MNPFASPWIPAVALLLLACLARLLSRSWLAPGPFALLTWSMYLIVPLAVVPEYKVPAIGVWVILLLVVCTAIGADLGGGRAVAEPPGAPHELSHLRKIPNLGVFFSFLGLAGTLYWAWRAFKGNGLDFSLPGLFSLESILSVDRYAGEQPPLVVRALVIWIFPSALLGGMSLAIVHSGRRRLLCLAAIIPTLLLSIMQATRANTLIVFILGLSGYLAVRTVVGRGSYALLNRKTIIMVAGALVAALSFFFVIDALRYHKQQDEGVQLDPDWSRAKSAGLGYLAVFSHWAESPGGLAAFQFGAGAYTFGGMFDVAGIHPRQVGVYLKSVSLQGEDSNIYTVFRGLIEDFSLPGAVIFCLAVGFLAGLAYRNSSLGREAWTVGLAAFYGFLIWSPIASLFLYNGPILSMLVCAFALKRSPSATLAPTTVVRRGSRRLGIT